MCGGELSRFYNEMTRRVNNMYLVHVELEMRSPSQGEGKRGDTVEGVQTTMGERAGVDG